MDVACNICESLWLLECVVQLLTMGNDQPALRALFACESGLSEQGIGLEHARVRSFDLAKEARQMGEMAKFAREPGLQKQLQLL